ncbi:MAG: hypothetical protein ACHQC8_00905 [Solirubrobacterales bacterium]
MANYLLAYKGGSMAQTDAEREEAMKRWGGWFGSLGQAVVDAGNPFGPSTSVAQNGDGGASSELSGYSILTAGSLADAAQLAKDCPVIAAGGSVDIYETIPIM